ncbi:MAG TPA: gliding motility-associated C-terminal domain-containing protein, partial [Chitinophagales bacterium]|nr:gliding motility-associated C-terminal domain-containing protein [Chitinophagales bacterium]
VINPVTAFAPPACYGGCNGAVSVTVNGGVAPYTYEWRNSSGVLLGNGVSVNNLCAGVYAVQVRDSNSCTTPFVPVTLNQPDPLNDSTHVLDPYCDGGQGSINLTPYGGTGPYSFSWNNGTYTTEDIGGLSSGTFTVQITDANNCIKHDTVTFTLLPLLTVQIRAHSYNGYNFKCYNGNDGEVVADVSGGLPPYTYQWDDSLASAVDSIYGLSPGLYHVTVTDANGCVRVDSVNLNLVPPPYSLNETHQNIPCAGDTSGSITITPVGGVPPYLAYWRHDNNLTATQITNIDTGEYVIYVFDSVFCLRIDTIHIDGAIPLTVSNVSADVLCPGEANGSVDLTVSGGTPPYTFSWNGGTYLTGDINGLVAGTYIVIAADSNGCEIADTALISDPPAITTQVDASDATCFGVANGSVNLTVTNAVAPVVYNWNSGLYSSEDLLNVAAGTYTVLLTDNNNCTAVDTATVNQPAFITGNRLLTICATDSVFAGGSYQNTTGVYQDTLTAPNGCDSLLYTSLTVINQVTGQAQASVCFGQSLLYNGNYYGASGIYIDTLMSEAGCDSVVTLTLTVLPDLDINATPNTARLNIGDSITISMVANSSSGSVSYTWYPVAGLSCADCPSAVVLPEFDTHYTVVGIDTSGCIDTTVVPIFVNPPVLFIPNVFTPNSDGTNDFFEIFGNLAYLRQLEVNIFDRWGEKVFESNDHHFKWDGTFKGKPMMPAVFVYTISARFANDSQSRMYKGSVTLLR